MVAASGRTPLTGSPLRSRSRQCCLGIEAKSKPCRSPSAQPGPGVRLVEPTTLSVQLQRWEAGIRRTLAGNLELLTPAGPGRWTTANTPMHISPNADVAGSSFFLAVALNMTLEYQDGSRYGISGGEPDARTTFFDIRTDVAPFGAGALMTGGIGIALMVVSSRRRRRPAPWRGLFPR